MQLLRSAVWLLIYWTKYHASQSVIVLRRCSNYVLEYTLDLVQQVPTLFYGHFDMLHADRNYILVLLCNSSFTPTQS